MRSSIESELGIATSLRSIVKQGTSQRIITGNDFEGPIPEHAQLVATPLGLLGWAVSSVATPGVERFLFVDPIKNDPLHAQTIDARLRVIENVFRNERELTLQIQRHHTLPSGTLLSCRILQ